MTQVRLHQDGSDVDAITVTTGVKIPHESNLGCKLASGTTYYFPVGDKDSTYKSIHLKWDAAVIVTFTLWGSNQPANLGGMGGGGTDTTEYSTANGDWIQINPSTAVVGVTSDDGSTGGATPTAAVIVVAGGTAGGALIDIGVTPSARLRIRAVVGGTGGKVRATVHGKE